MKILRHIIPGLLGALLLGPAARADTENPYGAIITRNVFGLVPIPTNPPVDPTPPAPPTKITPNGIMDIFGKLQALFKVAMPAKGALPAHDESYVLSEGEQQDEIEVIKIDKKGGIITFNNHGKVEELPLVVGVASGGAAPAGGGGVGMPGAAPGGPPGIPGANRFGNRFGAKPNQPPGSNPGAAGNPGAPESSGAAGQPGFGSAGLGNRPPAEEQLSPEAQVLMIEKNRLDTQEAVNNGLMPPLPPTSITPSDATAHGGSPLMAPIVPPSPK